jgi:hypothetical protein
VEEGGTRELKTSADERFYEAKVKKVSPTDLFVEQERGRGLSWKTIWFTYFAEEFGP